MRPLAFAALLLAGIHGAIAADVPPAQYQLEKPQALTGSYAVVAPIWTGTDGENLSYIRLANGKGIVTPAATATFNITVVGTPSGNVYGTTSIQVPAAASPQYSITDILSAAGAGPLINGDLGYQLYIASDATMNNTAFQHVIFNGKRGFFENVSACQWWPDVNYTGKNQLLTNVHTSALADYPAYVSIQNYGAAQPYSVQIFDARNGDVVGTVTLQIPANSTWFLPFSYFEQQLKWTPAANQQHVNLYVTSPSQSAFNAYVADFIYNATLDAYVNMTMFCGIVH